MDGRVKTSSTTTSSVASESVAREVVASAKRIVVFISFCVVERGKNQESESQKCYILNISTKNGFGKD